MKKIFAIALALVMVLSMASAFALSDCFGNFAWPCADDVAFCGRGTVEVVPYVKVNSTCSPFYDFEQSNCAGAVAGEFVYYAVQLNVEANPDAKANEDASKKQAAYWWDKANITFTYDGLKEKAPAKITFKTDTATDIDWDNDEAASYLYDFVKKEWVDVEDVEDIEDYLTKVTVVNPHEVEICAELASEHTGIGTWYYGDYKVVAAVNSLTVTKGSDKFVYTVAANTESIEASSPEFRDEVNELFNLNGCTLGTCMTEKNIKANFGWDSEQEDCATWSDKVAAIVDSECVVAIPKTGDASVLAWLF